MRMHAPTTIHVHMSIVYNFGLRPYWENGLDGFGLKTQAVWFDLDSSTYCLGWLVYLTGLGLDYKLFPGYLYPSLFGQYWVVVHYY